MSAQEDWNDERTRLPLKLVRKYQSWTCTIEECRDHRDAPTGDYGWSVTSDAHPDRQSMMDARGVAPTLEAARLIVEHVLLDYAIKIPVSGSESTSSARSFAYDIL